MINTFRNIFKIPDLRKKILWTLGLLIVYRLGTFLPIPGINSGALAKFFENAQQNQGALGQVAGLVDMFAGGALGRATIFALGIMPYISASIIFQLLTAVVPSLEKLAKEGESGRRKITQYTRYLTVGLCLIQGSVIANWLQGVSVDATTPFVDQPGFTFMFFAVLTVTAGTTFLMWLGEQIDEYGIGSGISLIIMSGILSRFIPAIKNVATHFQPQLGTLTQDNAMGFDKIAVLIALFIFMIIAVIIITQGQRRVPVQQAKRTRGTRVYGGQRTYLPLRVNQGGVIPIIFASSILMFPAMLSSWEPLSWLGEYFSRGSGAVYIVTYLTLIVFFSFFYAAITFNPVETAERFKQYGSFVPGIRPGKKTAEYFEYLLLRVTLAGSIFLAFIAIVPIIVYDTFSIDYMIAGFLGGTGLLIVVGVALDVVEKINSHLLMRHYEGFVKKGKIRGRR